MPQSKLGTSQARSQLSAFYSTQHVIDAISAANNIIVITGAGISVSCGIPDFRSRDGIYNTLQCDQLNLPSPELLFDSEFFSIDPAPFYKFIRHAFPVDAQPSATHRFIRLLETKNKLLRNYTQNIDGLEAVANINRVAECHGSFSSFKCLVCRSVSDKDSCWQDVRSGLVPECPTCKKGIMKPAITFFGDVTPARHLKHLENDVASCDLLLVIGTSLKVGGVTSKILQGVAKHVPQVLINKEAVIPPAALSSGFDAILLGAADDICSYLTASLGWGSLNIPYDTVIPKTNRKTAVSRKKTAGANTEIFVTIESKPESDGCTRSYNIRYATEHERLAWAVKANTPGEPVAPLRCSLRRKPAKNSVPEIVTVMLSTLTNDAKPKAKKRKNMWEEAEETVEEEVYDTTCDASGRTKRRRKVSRYLSRMYVL